MFCFLTVQPSLKRRLPASHQISPPVSTTGARTYGGQPQASLAGPTAPVTAPERLASHIGPSFDTVRRPNVSTTARGTIRAGHPPHRGPRSVRLPRRRAHFTPSRPSPVRMKVLRPGKRSLLHGQPRPGGSLESSGDGLDGGPGVVFVVGRAGIQQPWKADLSVRVSARILPHLPVEYPGLPVALDVGL